MLLRLLILLLPVLLIGQNPSMDSIRSLIRSGKQDTTQVNNLYELARLIGNNDPDTLLILGKQALTLSQKIGWKVGEAKGHVILGIAAFQTGDPDQALKQYQAGLKVLDPVLSSSDAALVRSSKKVKAILLTSISQLYAEQGSYSEAINVIKVGLKISGEISDKKTMANLLTILGRVYYGMSEYDSALRVNQRAIILARELKDDKLLARANTNNSGVYIQLGEYEKALSALFDALSRFERTKDQQSVAKTFGNIANVYNAQSNYPKSLEYLFKSLSIAEKINDLAQIGVVHANLSVIYTSQTDYEKALEQSFKGLAIAEKTGNKRTIGIIYGNVAAIYGYQLKYSQALDYYFKSLKVAEELGDEQSIGGNLTNIGSIFQSRADSAYDRNNENYAKQVLIPQAISFFIKGAEVSEKISDLGTNCRALGNLGHMYLILENYREAEKQLKNALQISSEIGALDLEMDHHVYLSILYERTQRPSPALLHYKRYIALRDTIYSQENSQKLLRTEMDHEYDKKRAVAEAEHKLQIENHQQIAQEKEKKQNIIILSVIGGLVLVMIFAGLIFRSLRLTNKQKLIIEQKNAETEHQKKEIEEKQKEILDSIHYAKKIQMAQIPSNNRVGNILNRLRI